MKFALVPGFNVRDGGANTVDRLAPFIWADEDWEVDCDEADYGYFNLFMIRWFKRKHRARMLYRLAEAFEDADVIITHSNGAHFTTQALNMLPPHHNNEKIVVHISPALNSSTPIPEAVKAQLVLHTPHDGWVRLASFLPLHPWGRMGARGYTGDSNKNTNVEMAEVRTHSGWFKPMHVTNTWIEIHRYLKEHKS